MTMIYIFPCYNFTKSYIQTFPCHFKERNHYRLCPLPPVLKQNQFQRQKLTFYTSPFKQQNVSLIWIETIAEEKLEDG